MNSTAQVSAESSGVATTAAKGLHCLPVAEAIIDPFGSGRCQNLFQLLGKYIAQGKISLVVKAAGNYRSVAQHTQLIPQAVAKYPFTSLLGRQIRPIELISIFQEGSLCDLNTLPLLLPLPKKGSVQFLQNLFVQRILTALIPQPVHHDLSPCGQLSKFQAAAHIVFQAATLHIGFKSVERDIDLMQGWLVQQHFLHFRQQRAVGGEDHPKAARSRHTQKFLQLGVAQGLAHQVEIQIVRVGAQLGKQRRKFLCGHSPARSLCSGAEAAF